jgi:hypothetical protein
MSETLRPTFPEMAERVWKALMARDDPTGKPCSDTPPALKLIVSDLLLSEGFLIPSHHDFLMRTADVLNATPAGDALTDMPWCEKRVLLHTFGLHSMPQLIDSSDLMACAKALPLTACAAGIEDLLLRINCFTAYGTRNVTMMSSDFWVGEVLVGLTIHFLRQYDFIMGCRLLRSVCYLSAGPGSSFNECVNFLKLHQRPEGAFGFFGPEEAEMKKTMSQSFSPESDLYLPVTIGCLLALGECSGNWRLYETLPQVTLARG